MMFIPANGSLRQTDYVIYVLSPGAQPLIMNPLTFTGCTLQPVIVRSRWTFMGRGTNQNF